MYNVHTCISCNHNGATFATSLHHQPHEDQQQLDRRPQIPLPTFRPSSHTRRCQNHPSKLKIAAWLAGSGNRDKLPARTQRRIQQPPPHQVIEGNVKEPGGRGEEKERVSSFFGSCPVPSPSVPACQSKSMPATQGQAQNGTR